MTREIKVDLAGFQEGLQGLERAISELEPFSKAFLQEAAWAMEGFQSDFTEKLQGLLENLTDTEAPKLLEDLTGFIREAQDVKEAFEVTEEELKGQWEGRQ